MGEREEGREQGWEGGKKRDGERREGGGRMVSKRETESSSEGFQEH